jgi:predicted DNA binding CopG/RHH family protein
MKPKIPTFDTDTAAEHFVDNANLAEYDLSGGVPIQFDIPEEPALLRMPISQPLLDAVKARAKAEGLSYTQYIEGVLKQAVNHAP